MLSRCVCAVALLGIALGLARFADADPLTVKTTQGKVHGKPINGGKVRAFLGIPYAAPPVGDLRWRPPQPAAKWKSVRIATGYGAHCMQVPFPDMSFQDAGMSEDCLYLNVFTPANARGKHFAEGVRQRSSKSASPASRAAPDGKGRIRTGPRLRRRHAGARIAPVPRASACGW